jgi:hypothetical protein
MPLLFFKFGEDTRRHPYLLALIQCSLCVLVLYTSIISTREKYCTELNRSCPQLATYGWVMVPQLGTRHFVRYLLKKMVDLLGFSLPPGGTNSNYVPGYPEEPLDLSTHNAWSDAERWTHLHDSEW